MSWLIDRIKAMRAFRVRGTASSAPRPLTAREIGARSLRRMKAEAERATAAQVCRLCHDANLPEFAVGLTAAGASVAKAHEAIDAELQRRQRLAQLRARMLAEVRAEKRKRKLADGAEDSPLAAAVGDPYGWGAEIAKVAGGARRAPTAG